MIEKIASMQGINNDKPNVVLAEELVRTRDERGIAEIAAGLDNPDKKVASDCIKVLYEIGYRSPELIARYAINFVDLLLSNNNRMIWGSMTALGTIAHLRPEEIFAGWTILRLAYETGSVITVDHAMTVFSKLCQADERYERTIAPLLLKHFGECKAKDIPPHSERVADCMTNSRDLSASKKFLAILNERLPELSAAGAKRVKK